RSTPSLICTRRPPSSIFWMTASSCARVCVGPITTIIAAPPQPQKTQQPPVHSGREARAPPVVPPHFPGRTPGALTATDGLNPASAHEGGCRRGLLSDPRRRSPGPSGTHSAPALPPRFHRSRGSLLAHRWAYSPPSSGFTYAIS